MRAEHQGPVRRAGHAGDPALRALLFVLILGLVLRLLYVWHPLVDAHSWRQVTNADIARNLAELGFDWWAPRVSWGGPDGRVGMEFPLLQALGAVAILALGEQAIWLRLVAVAFSMATIVGIYLTARAMFESADVALGAAFFMAISPSAVFFGRSYLSDTPMLCFSVFAVWAAVRYADTSGRRFFLAGVTAASLAALVKLPAILVLAPMAWALVDRRGWRVVSDRALLSAVAVVVIVTGLWYFQAWRVYQHTGLTQAIFAASGTWPPALRAVANASPGVSHWTTSATFLSGEVWMELADRLWMLHLTPVGAAAALVGLVVTWSRPRRRIVDVWMLAFVALMIVSLDGQYAHEFHQLPLLAPAALYFGLGAERCFSREFWWPGRGGPVRAFALGAVVLAIVALGMRASRVIPEYFRPDRLYLGVIETGRTLASATPPDALVVAVEYKLRGNHSPLLLYYAHRRGWSVDVETVTPHLVDELHARHGADVFVTTQWTALAARHPTLAAVLERLPPVPLGGAPSDVRAYFLAGETD